MPFKKKRSKIIVCLLTIIAIVSVCYFGYFEYEGYKKDGYFKYTIYDLDPSKKADQELMEKIREENVSETDKEWERLGIPDLPGFPGELEAFLKTYNGVIRLGEIYWGHYYKLSKPGSSFNRYLGVVWSCQRIPKSFAEAFTPKGRKCDSPFPLPVDGWGRPYAIKYDLENGKICIKSYGRRIWNPWDDIEGCILEKDNLKEYEMLSKLCHKSKDTCPDGEGWN